MNTSRGDPKPPPLRNKAALFLLTTDQAAKTSFPEGCPVYYNFRRGSAGSGRNDGNSAVLDAREGIVRSVSLNTEDKRFEYQIERRGSKNGNKSQASLILDEAVEDDIAYAVHCPVWIVGNDTRKNKVIDLSGNSSEERKIEGEILFATSSSYIVKYDQIDGTVRMEEHVAPERISYNAEQKCNNQCNGNHGHNNMMQDPIINEQRIESAPPVVVPNFSSNNSNAEQHCEKREPSQVHQHDTNLPQSKNVYVQKESTTQHQNYKQPPDTSTQFDVAASPLTCDFSEEGDNNRKNLCQDGTNLDNNGKNLKGPFQHQMINFEPPDPSRKRKNDAAMTASPKKQDIPAMPPSDRDGKRKHGEQYDAKPSSLRSSSLEANEERSSKKKKKSGREEVSCQLTVPLWVLDCPGNLFPHLVGVEKSGIRGHKTKMIYSETHCKVQISRFNRMAGEPMRITISTCSKGADMNKAISMVEGHIQNFLREDGANGRLSFELRAESATSPLIPRSQSGAVEINHHRWIQLVELPCVRNGGIATSRKQGAYLQRNLQSRIWDCTKCSVELFIDSPGRPLKYCKPYVLIHGKELAQVEQATAMVTNAYHE